MSQAGGGGDGEGEEVWMYDRLINEANVTTC